MTTHAHKRITAGRVLISLAAVTTAVGPYLADWNRTHIYNPAWPPHAKFHNAQTMSTGVALGALTVYNIWNPNGNAKHNLKNGAAAASVYWLTQISALAYPGTSAANDCEGGENDCEDEKKGRFPQSVVALPSLAAVALGYILERRRLKRL
ncbi:DUF6640 family protein [Streptomyces sp. NPDC059479]|uniref:DUF6640 family protein n=1 Tax=Streptomyces sp. NPDC059479 TaxID=3346848 RepID=UPI00368F1111